MWLWLIAVPSTSSFDMNTKLRQTLAIRLQRDTDCGNQAWLGHWQWLSGLTGTLTVAIRPDWDTDSGNQSWLGHWQWQSELTGTQKVAVRAEWDTDSESQSWLGHRQWQSELTGTQWQSELGGTLTVTQWQSGEATIYGGSRTAEERDQKRGSVLLTSLGFAK